ncbi:unnamed protein product [Protopolystoma xenopodis]|uniref:Uncharacterized protein n=1 Tax=Protopolystoma xenopodis TaxID=117903 RepID=A0A3S5ACZ0_9PLAT|nr:unnamed protein product [Protopolystoma xenopodis]
MLHNILLIIIHTFNWLDSLHPSSSTPSSAPAPPAPPPPSPPLPQHKLLSSRPLLLLLLFTISTIIIVIIITISIIISIIIIISIDIDNREKQRNRHQHWQTCLFHLCLSVPVGIDWIRSSEHICPDWQEMRSRASDSVHAFSVGLSGLLCHSTDNR